MTEMAFILAAGFITPAFFVAGALLASIPIIIHILNRRRYRTVEWAAMDFLLRAMRKNRRRIRFEQWLLLAVRCLVLALLGLALARPLGCEDSALANLAGKRARLHVIVIDNSYSMNYEADRPDAKTHLDQAKLMAKRLIDRLTAGGESVAVIAASRPASAVIAAPAFDLNAAKLAIDRIEPTNSGTDILGALQKALEIGRQSTNVPDKRLYLFTDATRSAWETPHKEATAAIGKDLARTCEVVHFNLSRPSQWNHAVIDLRAARDLVRSGFANDFQTTIRGYGAGAQSDAILQWKLDDKPLPGGGTLQPGLDTPPQTQSQSQIKDGGPHVVGVALASDNRLKVDDNRWRVVDVAAELKVLIVEGERGVGAMAGSGAFLELALAPPSEDARASGSGRNRTNSYVLPERISDLELGGRVLGDYRAVILAGVGQISAPLADQIQKFVEQGGTLMLFMGEPVTADNYNQTLLSRGLLPGPLTKRLSAAAGEQFRFDFKPNGPMHPLLSIFRGEENSGLDTAPIFSYWQVELPPDTRAQRVLSFLPDDKGAQDPAITLHTLGQGRVIFVSTTANADWTNLPAKVAYVTLMHELLAGTVGGGDAWMNLVVGQPLQIPSSIQLTATPVLKDAQQVDVIMEQATAQDGRTVYRTRPLAKPGVYTLLTGARKIPIVVNVPDDEADIRSLDNSAIRSALGEIDVTLEGDELPAIGAQATGRDFGWSFMIVVLGLVGLECFLAMRFGHYKR